MTETTEKLALMEAVVADPAAGAHVTPELQQAFDAGTPLVGGGRPDHPLILEARREAREGWNWDKIQADLQEQKAATLAREDGGWDEDDTEMIDEGMDEVATYVWIGTHVITPSAKVYTIFATGNLAKCPECAGKGVVDPEKYTPRDKLYIAEAERLPDMKYTGERTSEWQAHVGRKNALTMYGLGHSCSGWYLSCNLCDGLGVHEPEIDSAWYAEMERLANERDMFIDQRETDGDYQIGITFTLNSSPDDDEHPHLDAPAVIIF